MASYTDLKRTTEGNGLMHSAHDSSSSSSTTNPIYSSNSNNAIYPESYDRNAQKGKTDAELRISLPIGPKVLLNSEKPRQAKTLRQRFTITKVQFCSTSLTCSAHAQLSTERSRALQTSCSSCSFSFAE